MIAAVLRQQLASRALAARVRGWCAAFAVALAAVIAVRWTADPAAMVEAIGWTALLGAIVAGACLTGWRVAQFPKSRAAEFHLVVPAGDWEIIGGEILGGFWRTAVVLATCAPLVAWLCGAGWISPAEGAALLLVPLSAGWLTGVGLAVVAYEPPWVRRLCERALLGLIVAYLVLFGLAGSYFLPWALRTWHAWTGSSAWTLSTVGAVWSYFNPFRVLGMVGRGDTAGMWLRVAAVCGALMLLTALCCWRLALRLRPHYLEENFGRPRGRREHVRPIGDNPLAWWTERRVTRFRGHVNLYLTWCVVGLYCTWLFLGERFPAWLGSGVLRRIEEYGGEALLAAACLQLAVVGVAFLDGLWDSNLRQRLGRLELLLVSPLVPRQYLTASLVAGWTRGRGYVLAMLALWIATAAAGRIAWATSLLLCALSLNYMLLVFALAFRNFGQIAGERAGAMWGLALSIGQPLVAWGLHAVAASSFAVATPLGAIYALTLRPEARAELLPAGWSSVVLIAASSLLVALVSRRIIANSLARFDSTIRASFARHAGANQG